MAELLLRNLLIVLVIAATVITAFSVFTIGIGVNYDKNIDENLTQLYGEMNYSLYNASDDFNDMEAGLEGSEGWSQVTDNPASDVWNSITLSLNSLKYALKSVSIVSKTMALPSFVKVGITAIIVLMLAMALFSIAIRKDS